MMLPLPWIALILGLVEGITEFLPISSTGHLILAERLCGFTGARADVFAIFIQLGAVVAVVVEYRVKLWTSAKRLGVSVFVAFLPFATLGLIAHGWIEEHLFSPRTIAMALIAGAVAILAVEKWKPEPRWNDTTSIGPRRAALIGLAQCVALWPGFSRSAATILGGLLCGLERKAATEFSFFLAVPTLGAATVYSFAKNRHELLGSDVNWLTVATLVSFLVAWASIRWLVRFVATHDLTPFAWYRIALGIVVLIAT